MFILCAFMTAVVALQQVESLERTYYIGIREEDWNYAPSTRNLINNRSIDQDEHASIFLSSSPTRIGSIYKKAVYKQYKDDSYSKEIEKPGWLGFLGPILRAEVDDVIVVHLKNFATRPYSLHPHGVFYKKDSEGALYPDGTSGHDKRDDAVAPGESHTYTWEVKPEYAPTEEDAPCLTWIYHSHGDAPKDIASGLIGALLTCKKGQGTLNSRNKRSDVDEDFILMFSVVDENLSWYLEENIERFCSDTDKTKELMEVADEAFKESNLMHSINGYVYGNLPSLKVCAGRTVSWHLFGIGNEVDVHSAYFHGHTLMDRMHRTDVLSLFPATFVTATMIPRTVGKWLLSCQVNDHVQAGMQGFYEVSACGSSTSPGEAPRAERRFFIAAEEMDWDYAPSGFKYMENTSLTEPNSDSEPFFSHDGGKLGGKYLKARYVSYTDETFTTKTHIVGSDAHLGVLGPVIRAETGDVIIVTFLNNATRDYSIQPHGLHYEKAYEGAMYQDGSQKAPVAPGKKFTYHWRVIEGPSSSDPPCLSYLYYSAVDPVRDSSSGLVGPIQVCRKGVLDGSGHQRADKIQHEFFLLFSVMDENESWYLEENIKKFGNRDSNPEDEEFQESNKMHAVNGFMYGNLPGLELCNREHVVWHMLGLGTELDIHGIYFQGNTFQRYGTNRDTLSIFPHTTATVTMTPDNNGKFELSCRTTDHFNAGMRQYYTVKSCSAETPAQERFTSTVQYFIAAEELVWKYAPDRTWELEKHNATKKDSIGSVYLERLTNRIGAEYKKVVFREYSDDTFTTKKPRSPDEEHLGIMGPILRAQVGERIQVVFKNKASRPYSVHAHGVKTSEPHQDGVQPGHVLTYNWTIPERSGPGPNDPKCITFAYYSSVNFVKDLMSGLVGPLIVCRKDTLNSDRRRGDADKEFALLFMVFDENESHYLDENIETYLKADQEFDKYDGDFMESNKMHGINGKMYANLHGLNMTEKQKIKWYLLGLGNEVDMHTVHFHAQSFIYKTDHSHRADVFDLFPGTFQTIEMIAGNPGQWLLHCHVTDHIHAGMEAIFTVNSKGTLSTRQKGSKMTETNNNAFRHFGSLYTVLVSLFGLFLLSHATH